MDEGVVMGREGCTHIWPPVPGRPTLLAATCWHCRVSEAMGIDRSYAPTSTASFFCPGFLASAAEVLWQEVLWSWPPRRQAPPGWGPYASS